MSKPVRGLLHRYVPAQFHDPLGLTMRLLRSRDPAALFAMETALLGLLLSPLDLLLQRAEERRYQQASQPRLPLIFVCGAPRTGTTVVAQTLIRNLPVSFFNNLTSIFPRSPIVANLLFGKLAGTREITYKSYYGKSDHLSGPNDALYLWDRWLGKDRARLPTALSEAAKNNMRRFFGAYEEAFRLPLVAKNNNLNTCASLVADVLENAYFLCMTRDPVYLAQSLLRARLEIHGTVEVTYGIGEPNRPKAERFNAIEDVCQQVLFHERKIEEQQRLIGPERFWIIAYEKFCQRPAELVKRVSEQILRQPLPLEQVTATLKPFEIANRINVDPEVFGELEQTLRRLKRTANVKDSASVP